MSQFLTMFHVTKVYSDSNGDSHSEDLEIPLVEAGSVGRLSQVLPARGVVFREVELSYDWNFHAAMDLLGNCNHKF